MEDKGFSDAPAPAEAAAPKDPPEQSAAAGVAVARELVAAAEDYADDAEALGTAVTYRKHWTAFETWCAGQNLCALPAAPQTLAAYLALRADQGRRPATLRITLRGVEQAAARRSSARLWRSHRIVDRKTLVIRHASELLIARSGGISRTLREGLGDDCTVLHSDEQAKAFRPEVFAGLDEFVGE
jgi:hypothetical protein